MTPKRIKRIIFGNCASGKSRRIEGMVLKSLSHERKALVFCRIKEGESLSLKAASSVKGLSSDNIFCRCLKPGNFVRPGNTLNSMIFDSARLVIFGMETHGIIRGDLAANFLKIIFDTRKSFIGDLDIYLDDAQLWGADAIKALPGGATLACQSLSQLDVLIGEEQSDYLVESSQECEFFRCSDRRTIDKAIDLSNGQIGLELMSLEGVSFLIERSVRVTRQETKLTRWKKPAWMNLVSALRRLQER